ncbi:hypothetical protein KGF54_000541 [Candida jiufengensis]|uniref:uncharacterized protein n=1 Tax=Candida jiufengensis TaxID=497108 RepID=UPI002224F9A5|nr:uncharacterized protein KGF54_000541 [Candida jiufengensis]KAI5956922.1 hypothetical protein KGF54_000541 [Candida jiufengensis]
MSSIYSESQTLPSWYKDIPEDFRRIYISNLDAFVFHNTGGKPIKTPNLEPLETNLKQIANNLELLFDEDYKLGDEVMKTLTTKIHNAQFADQLEENISFDEIELKNQSQVIY